MFQEFVQAEFTEQASAYEPPTTSQILPERFSRKAILLHHVQTLLEDIRNEVYNNGVINRRNPMTSHSHWKGKIVNNVEMLQDMKMVQIDQLQLSPNNSKNNPNRGKYLFARICQFPFKRVSIMTILENGVSDQNAKIVQIAIYNYDLQDSYKILEEFRVGRFVVIKNPFYKIYVDEWPGLRIDNPNELFFVDDEKVVKELKSLGLKLGLSTNSSENIIENTPPKWKSVKKECEIPERMLHSGFLIKDYLLLYWGGVSMSFESIKFRSVEKSVGELLMLDTYSNIVSLPRVTGDIPEAGSRSGHIFIPDSNGKFAYLFGGGSKDGNDGSFRLCLTTFKWKKLNLKFELFCSSAAVVNDFIYIFGGVDYSTETNVYSDTLFRYDIGKDKLQKVKKVTNEKWPPIRNKACMEYLRWKVFDFIWWRTGK